MSQDWDKIAAIENAIKEKYGQEAIHNPKANWDNEKEQDYIRQVKECFEENKAKHVHKETIQEDGFLIKKKLITTKTNRVCPVIRCGRYSFSLKDDVYMNKYGCCYECYIRHVDGREESWKIKRKEMTNCNDET